MEIKTIRQEIIPDEAVKMLGDYLTELPTKVYGVRNALVVAENALTTAKMAVVEAKELVDGLTMEAVYEVSIKVDYNNKPLYGNDAKRKAAAVARLKDNAEYVAVCKALKNLKISQIAAEQVVANRVNDVKLQIDTFDSIKARANLVTGLAMESVDSRNFAYALKQITKNAEQEIRDDQENRENR